MGELRMQRAVLWFVVAMGFVSTPYGMAEPSWWWATLLGLGMIVGGIWGIRRVNRDIKDEEAVLHTVMDETIFREELARNNGRLDLAREAVEQRTIRGVNRSRMTIAKSR
jgi:hypothetical protein